MIKTDTIIRLILITLLLILLFINQNIPEHNALHISFFLQANE